MKEMKSEENETPKTYVVYQDKYGTGYKVYDPSLSRGPSEFDIVESFEAEVGAVWFGCESAIISLDKDDIEEAGYTLEDLDNMSNTELYKAVCKIHQDIWLAFCSEGLIEECADGPSEAYNLEDNGDDYVEVTVLWKHKYIMGEGEVEEVEVE